MKQLEWVTQNNVEWDFQPDPFKINYVTYGETKMLMDHCTWKSELLSDRPESYWYPFHYINELMYIPMVLNRSLCTDKKGKYCAGVKEFSNIY